MYKMTKCSVGLLHSKDKLIEALQGSLEIHKRRKKETIGPIIYLHRKTVCIGRNTWIKANSRMRAKYPEKPSWRRNCSCP